AGCRPPTPATTRPPPRGRRPPCSPPTPSGQRPAARAPRGRAGRPSAACGHHPDATLHHRRHRPAHEARARVSEPDEPGVPAAAVPPAVVDVGPHHPDPETPVVVRGRAR